MTQTQNIPHWCLTFQLKLMAALDAAWKILEATDNPAEIRAARDRAKGIGEMAAVARKIALAVPTPRGKPGEVTMTDAVAARLHATQTLADLGTNVRAAKAEAASMAAQVEPARRALDKLKGGRRGRL